MKKLFIYCLAPLVAVAAAVLAGPAQADLVGLWEFE